MNKLPWIDALRGIAIFSVLIYHTGLQIEDVPDLLQSLTSYGARGVQLFYLISAFTLFMSMSNRKKAENAPLKNFFIRRFFRIAPLFYCACAYFLLKLGLGPNYWVEDGESITIPNLLAHLTFTNGWHPYWINSLVPVGWSIAIEMPFYLVVPFLFKKIKSINQATTLTLIAIIFSRIISFILNKYPLIPHIHTWNNFVFYWLPNQFLFFLMGVILFFLIRNTTTTDDQVEVPSPTSQFRSAIMPLLLLCLFMIAFSRVTQISLNVIELICGIGFIGLALFLSHHSFFLLVNSFFCYLGQISYSAYLIHMEIMPIAKNFVQNALSGMQVDLPPTVDFILVFAVVLAGTMAISSLTYRFIEMPGMALGRYLITTEESKATKTGI